MAVAEAECNTVIDLKLEHDAAYRINLKGESMRKRVKKLTAPGASD